MANGTSGGVVGPSHRAYSFWFTTSDWFVFPNLLLAGSGRINDKIISKQARHFCVGNYCLYGLVFLVTFWMMQRYLLNDLGMGHRAG